MTPDTGWFEDVDPDELDARDAIEDGTAESPAAWPDRAIESGFAENEDDYYDKLREATIETAREAVAKRERADDQQLVHAVRAMDDCERTANELAERIAEWGGSRVGESGGGVAFAREIAEREPDSDLDEQLRALAEQVVDLDERATELRASIERFTPEVAPNLSSMAGPVLAARLIALAGGLKQLARSTSGTVQVLGAEDALFAHLRGDAPSPKHGVIYTHEYVRGTAPEHRGSAARALAGKLTLGARVDHYSGERRPELEAELDDRVETIRARGESQ